MIVAEPGHRPARDASRTASLALRRAIVLRVDTVTPRMRRVVLGGSDLADLLIPSDALGPFVKLLLPPDGPGPVAWPQVGANGCLAWPPASERRPAMRTYTVRHLDPGRAELTLDIVLHDTGIATDWARRVRAGGGVTLWGPGVTLPPPTDRWLLLGDHSALPAIASILENLPSEARGLAVIEVPDRGEEQSLRPPAGVEVVWLHRPTPHHPSRLVETLRAIPLPGDAKLLLFAGAEAAIAREIRRHARQERGLPRERVHVLNYWKRGAAEGAFDYAA